MNFAYIYFYRDAILIPLINSFTSIYAGFAVFAVLGFIAHIKNVDVADVADEGTNEGLVKMGHTYEWPEAGIKGRGS